jgi:hypothetical protein
MIVRREPGPCRRRNRRLLSSHRRNSRLPNRRSICIGYDEGTSESTTKSYIIPSTAQHFASKNVTSPITKFGATLPIVELPTDVRVVGAELYLLPVHTRMPLKFGAETLHTVTCARVRMHVRDRAGRTA